MSMASLELFFILFFLLSHCHLPYVSSNDGCPTLNCQTGEPPIRFPFRIKHQQNASCGYRGFDLSCDNKKQTVINLPSSGEFIVDKVYYLQQNIWLSDPEGCLPRRLQTFTTSGSTLRVDDHRKFSVFNCSADKIGNLPGLTRVSCLSSENYTIMVIPTDELPASDPGLMMPPGCTDHWTMEVPSVPKLKDLYSARTIETMALRWDNPACRSCEENHGTCSIKNEETLEITCSVSTAEAQQDLPKRSKWEMILGIMTPWILFILGVSYYIRKKSQAPDQSIMSSSSADLEQDEQIQRMAAGTLGMDSPALASYPKVQISENTSQLAGSREDTCAICLLEYRTNDTVKIIPECKHYFHDHCIDQWLRMRATCPLCRKQQHHQQLQIE